jgi:hypothetical protein
MHVPQRRIDDRLREIFTHMQTAPEGDLESLINQFLALVHEKIERLERRAATLFLFKGEHLEPERRQLDGIKPL